MPNPDCVPGPSQPAQITSTEPMDSACQAAYADEAVTESSTAVAAAAPSTDDIGLASQSSKGSSQMSFAAAASGVVTRLMRGSTANMCAASTQASDRLEVGQTQLSQPEKADLARLGEMAELPNNGTMDIEAATIEDGNSTDQIKSSEHSPARQACEGSRDVAMADGSTADGVATGAAEAAGPAVLSVTHTLPEAHSRLVSLYADCCSLDTKVAM